jgi:hypothetical protein
MNELLERELLVFNEALKLPVNERARYLRETCHGDVDLQRRVAVLLKAHEQAGAFIQ